MKNDRYSMIQAQIILIANIAAGLDLKYFLQRIETAEAIGPTLNPTLWMQGHKGMEKVKRLAKALVPLCDEVRKQREEADAE